MLDLAGLEELLADISFRDKDWTIRCGEDEDALWLQWTFVAEDNYTGEMELQRGRKWRICRHSTDVEAVNSAFLAVRVAIEHEAREEFTYKGKMIYNTHISLDAMLKAAESEVEMRA